MENKFSSSPKLFKPGSQASAAPSPKRGTKVIQPQPFRLQTEQRGQMKEQAFERRLREMIAEEAKHRIRIAQGLPLTTDKPQNPAKPPVKEQTKPLNIKLHTEQRAARRAGYNELVASKTNALEILKRFEEKIQKVIEEEEIKILRKGMVPRAQLMPIFDRPFHPQRSSRRPTAAKEPNILDKKCSASNEPHSRMHQYFGSNMNAIK